MCAYVDEIVLKSIKNKTNKQIGYEKCSLEEILTIHFLRSTNTHTQGNNIRSQTEHLLLKGEQN